MSPLGAPTSPSAFPGFLFLRYLSDNYEQVAKVEALNQNKGGLTQLRTASERGTTRRMSSLVDLSEK